MSEQPEDVLRELFGFISNANATLSVAAFGLVQLRAYVLQMPTDEEPDPQIIFGTADPNDPNVKPTAVWRRSEALVALEQPGMVVKTLGHQWIASIFTAWEHEYRGRLADAYGVEKAEVSADEFGDLRHMRNDVIHRHGLASAKNTGKCEVLKWFEPEQSIYIEDKHMIEFLERVSANPPQPRVAT